MTKILHFIFVAAFIAIFAVTTPTPQANASSDHLPDYSIRAVMITDACATRDAQSSSNNSEEEEEEEDEDEEPDCD